jgi:hypothetical protein
MVGMIKFENHYSIIHKNAKLYAFINILIVDRFNGIKAIFVTRDI